MPETRESSHSDVLAQCLTALGADPDRLLGYELLSGGASGACAYRLRLQSGDAFLKVTRPEGSAYLLERARREVLFYRHLASEARVQVPRMIANRCDRAIGACLLLEAYEPPPKPDAWTAAGYVEAAEHLGRFHAAFRGKGRELATLGWLKSADGPDAAVIRQACKHWERLRAEGRFERILTPKRYQWVLDMVGRIGEVRPAMPSLPLTLCHGDFHIDNILVDRAGGMVLADWQEVGLGHGPEDLSFFLQRASFSGGSVPVEEMIEAYRRRLSMDIGEDVPARDIRCVIETSELRTRLLHWPAFLTGAAEGELMDLLKRIQRLSNRLDTTLGSNPQA